MIIETRIQMISHSDSKEIQIVQIFHKGYILKMHFKERTININIYQVNLKLVQQK